MKNIFETQQFVFQLSSPRSGSTYMANLIDSAQNVCLINEPFTRNFIYDKSINIKDSEKEILRLINTYSFYKLKSKSLRFLFFVIIKILNRFFSIIGINNTFFKKVYHLNSLHQIWFKPMYDTTYKKQHINVIFFKCIRLKYAVDFIKDNNIKNYQIVHLLRHPLEVIESTIKQRNLETNLEIDIIGDVENYLKTFPNDSEFIKKFYKPNCAVTQLAINWVLINNYCSDAFSQVENYSRIFYHQLINYNEFSIEDLVKFKLEKEKKSNLTNKIIKNNNPRNIFKQIDYAFNNQLLDKYAPYKLNNIFFHSVFYKHFKFNDKQ